MNGKIDPPAEDWIETRDMPQGQTMIELKFWRVARTPDLVEKKKRELIRDVEFWLSKVKR